RRALGHRQHERSRLPRSFSDDACDKRISVLLSRGINESAATASRPARFRPGSIRADRDPVPRARKRPRASDGLILIPVKYKNSHAFTAVAIDAMAGLDSFFITTLESTCSNRSAIADQSYCAARFDASTSIRRLSL